MQYFNYLAQDNQGKQTRGSLQAKDMLEAKTKLRQLGFYIIWVRRENYLLEGLLFGRVKSMDLAIFSHQFAVMISSGIPLIRALKALGEEANNKKLGNIINKIRQDVENGTSLSEAFARHPKVFSNFFISLIKAGEAAGVLPTVLNRLANYFEKEEDLRRKVKSSFAYPIIVSIAATGVVIFLLIFIVPVFRSVYKTLRIDLPGPTLTLIILSNLVVKFWWAILLVAVAVYCSFLISKQNKKLSFALDRLKLRIPVFGQLNRKVAISRFVRTLSTLTGSGLTLNPSLTIVKDVVNNLVIGHAIESVQRNINQGKQISDALREEAFFPPIVLQMIAVGEESGNLNTLLDKCADFLDDDIDVLVKSLVVKLEPTLTLFLAVLVGFIAVAIYLPMFDLLRQITR
jgi:type IV pilus assembly protein PilC